ncbi:TIGR02281 family clan AA aspartic protease [Pseudomonadota bacterium]
MTSFRWLSIFILGACFGYGVALFVASEREKIEFAQPEKQPAIVPEQVAHQATSTKPELAQKERVQESKQQQETGLKLESAYIALVKEAVTKRDFTTALDLLADAEDQFGVTVPRLVLLAEIQNLRKDFKAARATLHQALMIDPTIAEQVYPLLRQIVIALTNTQDNTLTFNEKVQMLSEEIIDDPGFVTYYTLLGRLHYTHENYADAITHLEYALQLDHTQTATLSPLIDAAKQRLENPGLVEVPISAHGRSLNVDVKLNDARQSFRFILDTGATFTVISSDTAQKLGIVLSPNQPTMQISTANGIVQAPTIILNAVNLHGALVERVPAVVLNELNGFDGLLGLSFLNHFNIDINQDEGKLLLFKHSPNL